MAISAVNIYVNSGAAANTFTSAAFTPVANEQLIAFMVARVSSATIPAISGGGLTWTVVPGTNISAGSGNLKTATYQANAGASPPVGMTVTVNPGAGAAGCAIILVGFTGALSDTSNINIATSTVGDPAPTNSTMAATSTGLAFHGQNAGTAPTATPAAQGYTSVINSQPATNIRHSLFIDQASPANAVSWATTGTDSVGILWELKEDTGGGPSPITGTVAQATIIAAQSASGTVAAAGAITGTVVQNTSPAQQSASGTVTAAPAVTGTVANIITRTQQAASGTVTAVGAVTGTVAQTITHAGQLASGTVALLVVGTVAQTTSPAKQASSGTVTAAPDAFQSTAFQSTPAFQVLPPAVTGVVAQTISRVQQHAMGNITAPGAVIGDVVQTISRVQQQATGISKDTSFVDFAATAIVSVDSASQVVRVQSLAASSSVLVGSSSKLTSTYSLGGTAVVNILGQANLTVRAIRPILFGGSADINVGMGDPDIQIYLGKFWPEHICPDGDWNDASCPGGIWVPVTPISTEWREHG